jgi:cytosine/adenosine deaminase-related metal-dependent hydrolase
MVLLQADWVLPISAPPISRGAVVVRGGRIVEVGHAARLRREHWAERVLEYPGCVLLPGLVNTHTHLEYSAFRGLIQSSGFSRWMLALLNARRRLNSDDYSASALWGAYDCVRSGVTCIADTTYEGWVVGGGAPAPPGGGPPPAAGRRARVYVEVFGLDDARLPFAMHHFEERLEKLRAELEPVAGKPEELPGRAGGHRDHAAAVEFGGWSESDRLVQEEDEGLDARPRLVEDGVSPHAPYTVSARLYREAARIARRAGLRLATHLAESQAEVDLLTGRKSAITRVYQAANMWTGQSWVAPSMRPVQYLAQTGALGPDTLAIHTVQADAYDIATLAATGAAVAHCPRSNLRLQCGAAPVAELMAAGVVVGLGTDSLASNDSLDMFAEMRAALAVSRARGAAEIAGAGATTEDAIGGSPGLVLTADVVLRMATLDGARALGWHELVGSLEPGKRADVIAVSMPVYAAPSPDDSGGDVASTLVEAATADDVRMTMIDGKVMFDRKEGTFMPDEAVRGFRAARGKLGLSD